MDYEYMIDFLNENTQLDFLMYSIDVIGIDEGVMDILISMKNAMVNFFKKVGEFFSNMQHFYGIFSHGIGSPFKK